MYMGERLDAIPIAKPPIIRHGTNTANEDARAVPIDETANSIAAVISKRLRPNRSLRAPETIAPTRHPTSAQLIAQPCWEGSIKPKNF